MSQFIYLSIYLSIITCIVSNSIICLINKKTMDLQNYLSINPKEVDKYYILINHTICLFMYFSTIQFILIILSIYLSSYLIIYLAIYLSSIYPSFLIKSSIYLILNVQSIFFLFLVTLRTPFSFNLYILSFYILTYLSHYPSISTFIYL